MLAIWDAAAAIPRGRVATYGAVARAAGLPGRARLTGLALKIAPPGTYLPWHRVVGAGGRIVFPKGSAPYREQARRLRAEGIAVKDGRVARELLLELEER
jgi:methylated-DNA-protein-cysteine methyltransferase-like protein